MNNNLAKIEMESGASITVSKGSDYVNIWIDAPGLSIQTRPFTPAIALKIAHELFVAAAVVDERITAAKDDALLARLASAG